METGAQSVAGRLVSETVNDFFPGDPGSVAGKIDRQYPALGAVATASFPETDGTGPRMVMIAADDLVALLLASDVLAEHRKEIIASTPAIVGLDTLDVLSEAGLIDPETLDMTDDFKAAMVRAGEALGWVPQYLRSLAPVDDGAGIDDLAGANDDYEQDVEAAEKVFTKEGDLIVSPDPDWAGEPQPSILDALPRAGAFAHD